METPIQKAEFQIFSLPSPGGETPSDMEERLPKAGLAGRELNMIFRWLKQFHSLEPAIYTRVMLNFLGSAKRQLSEVVPVQTRWQSLHAWMPRPCFSGEVATSEILGCRQMQRTSTVGNAEHFHLT